MQEIASRQIVVFGHSPTAQCHLCCTFLKNLIVKALTLGFGECLFLTFWGTWSLGSGALVLQRKQRPNMCQKGKKRGNKAKPCHKGLQLQGIVRQEGLQLGLCHGCDAALELGAGRVKKTALQAQLGRCGRPQGSSTLRDEA